MTTCQRKHHIESINAFLENNGFKLDRVKIDSTTMENLKTLMQKLFKERERKDV